MDMSADSAAARGTYDRWADGYRADIQDWGYNMPAKCAELVHRHHYYCSAADRRGDSNGVQRPHHRDSLRLLDVGAGDGLMGEALRQFGFDGDYMIGADISPEILRRSSCYDETVVVDLNRQPNCLGRFSDHSIDILTCIGTLTYVDPAGGAALREFLRVVKPGGLVCYTYRTDKVDRWKPHEDRLEEEKKWKLVERSGPHPYLPGNPEFGTDVQVVICIYRVQ